MSFPLCASCGFVRLVYSFVNTLPLVKRYNKQYTGEILTVDNLLIPSLFVFFDMPINKKVREQVLARDKKCVDCGSDKDLTIDHIIPLSRGGINTPDNLRALCARCNRRKSSFIEWDFVERVVMALHVDEITTKFKEELKGTIASNLGTVRNEIETVSQSKASKVRGEVNDQLEVLRKEINGQAKTIAFLTKQLRALEAHNKVKWVEETTTFEGYKKL